LVVPHGTRIRRNPYSVVKEN